MYHVQDENPIFVGHSLFFRSFYSRHLSEDLIQNRPELAEKMMKYKLGNASVLAVCVDFPDNDYNIPVIVDADVLFNSDFEIK